MIAGLPVHARRETAAGAIVALGLMAYGVFQAFIYRELGLTPRKPQRTIGAIKRDLFESLADFQAREKPWPP